MFQKQEADRKHSTSSENVYILKAIHFPSSLKRVLQIRESLLCLRMSAPHSL